MKKVLILAVSALFLATFGVNAEEASAPMKKPYFEVTQSEMVTATVESINVETRDVTLKMADGEIVSFVASEEARNLDQVMPGDLVMAEYIERMSVQVVENDGQEPAMAGMTTIKRAKKGEMPGMMAVDTEVITATVEEINIEMNTFKLKGPDGTVEEYTAMNPENLKRAVVGDLVVMTMTHAVAVAVTPMTDE
jgi:hypothetical protein